MPLLNKPRKVTARVNKAGTVCQAPHPLLAGTTLRFGVAKLPTPEKYILQDELNKLVQAAPRFRSDVPPGIRKKLVENYFKRMEVRLASDVEIYDAEDPRTGLPVKIVFDEKEGEYKLPPLEEADAAFLDEMRERCGPDWGRTATGIDEFPDVLEEAKRLCRKDGYRYVMGDEERRAIRGLFKKIALAEKELLAKDQEADRQKRLLEAAHEALGVSGEFENAATLSQCWGHFKANFRTKNDNLDERDRNVSDVRFFLDALVELPRFKRTGWGSLFKSVTEADVRDAVAASAGENNRSKRTYYVKRFFRFLTLPKEKNGLGFRRNPAEGLSYQSSKTRQAERRDRGKIKGFDPEPYWSGMDIYWKALFATLKYAGLRLKELATLEWACVDFEHRIIRVRASRLYPKLKSFHSNRDIPAFWELFDILDEFRKGLAESGLVFKRPKPKRASRLIIGDTWLRWSTRKTRKTDARGAPIFDENGKPVTETVKRRPVTWDLSREIRVQLRAAGIETAEPARRMRRSWETLMETSGLGYLLPACSGHTEEVGKAHYKIFEQMVSKASVGYAEGVKSAY